VEASLLMNLMRAGLRRAERQGAESNTQKLLWLMATHAALGGFLYQQLELQPALVEALNQAAKEGALMGKSYKQFHDELQAAADAKAAGTLN
jgi:hypothetical protein